MSTMCRDRTYKAMRLAVPDVVRSGVHDEPRFLTSSLHVRYRKLLLYNLFLHHHFIMCRVSRRVKNLPESADMSGCVRGDARIVHVPRRRMGPVVVPCQKRLTCPPVALRDLGEHLFSVEAACDLKVVLNDSAHRIWKPCRQFRVFCFGSGANLVP